MVRSAQAVPFSYGKVFDFGIAISANMASLARWIESADLLNNFTIPLGFVVQHDSKFAHPNISHSLCQAMICHHAFHVQVFDTYEVVAPHQPSRILLKEVFALVGDILMKLRQTYSCLVSVVTALLFSGQTLLQ